VDTPVVTENTITSNTASAATEEVNTPVTTEKANTASTASTEHEESIQIIGKLITAAKPNKKVQRLHQVFLVFTCKYPLQNDKWGEDSGHETEDTELQGVYANLKDANRAAKCEAFFDEDESDESDDDEDDNDALFYWQEEHPDEWTCRRVWVEEETIHY
jgi:hypothetical protein